MKNDDTLRTGRQANEDTWMAQIESGLVDGMSFTRAETEEDMQALIRQAQEASIMMLRIPRATAERGCAGGFEQALFLAHMATQGVQNKVALAFDGWADDPRELWEIPVVVDFCRGMLGPAASDQYKAVIITLVDEADLAIKGDRIVDPSAFQLAGSLWLVGIAYPEGIFSRDPRSPTGRYRDIAGAITLRMALWEGKDLDPSA